MNEFWMIKSEGLLKSQMEIVDDHLNQAVSANYNDFLTGIKLIQEIDLDLSRSDIFVQNTRRMLEASRKQVTIISFTQFSFSIFNFHFEMQRCNIHFLNHTLVCPLRTSVVVNCVFAKYRASSKPSKTFRRWNPLSIW